MTPDENEAMGNFYEEQALSDEYNVAIKTVHKAIEALRDLEKRLTREFEESITKIYQRRKV